MEALGEEPFGLYPLVHFALGYGNMSALSVLLAPGADETVTTVSGLSPGAMTLLLAQAGNPEIDLSSRKKGCCCSNLSNAGSGPSVSQSIVVVACTFGCSCLQLLLLTAVMMAVMV